jgi:uncharacterized membrane protein YjdF
MKSISIFIVLFFFGLVLSGIHPKEYFTWFLEVVPALLGFLILLITFKKFSFTNFTYFFILLHCYVLFLGGNPIVIFNLSVEESESKVAGSRFSSSKTTAVSFVEK